MAADHEHDPEIAAGLRREWTEEAAEDEHLTELLRLRRRTIGDVVQDMAHRRVGARVRVDDRSFSGPVIWAGEDYATVRAPGQTIDVRFDACIWEETTAAGGDSDVARAESFAAILHELAASGERVETLLARGGSLMGRIDVVARDHVVVVDRDEQSVFVPRSVVVGVIRPSDSH